MTGAQPPVIVVPATPTSNGGLHVGHLAGPYLAADVYARYQQARGRFVLHTTCTDDSQSYVPASARRAGLDPRELCVRATAEIHRGLTALGTTLVGLPPVDESYRAAVLGFVTDLHAAGAFELKTVRFPFATKAGVWLYDGLVSGTCPACLAESCGGACETCGHPNNFDELDNPRYTLDPNDPVEHRELEILVLPLERWRDRLTDHYAAHTLNWRPRARTLIAELLSKPLPDVPVTVAGTWGVPAPFAETTGQVLYPWIEAMPAVMYSTWWSARQLGRQAEPVDQFWRAESAPEIAFFHGYDNVFHWSVLDLTLLLAYGDRYATPAVTIINEFYELAGEKFSTSRGHLVSATDLLERVPRDLARFYLALTAPELQRTNFTEEDLRTVLTSRLVEPWNRLAAALAALPVADGTPLPVSATGRERARIVAERLARHYAPNQFSPSWVADTIAVQLTRLADAGVAKATAGDVLVQVRALLGHAAPILIDVVGKVAADGVDTRLEPPCPVESVPMFRLPALPVLVPR